MQKQFVTYDIALKLKELGFDEECLAYYNPQEEFICGIDMDMIKYAHKYHKEDDSVLAPLWQQAIDWLAAEYKLVVEPIMLIDASYAYSIYKIQQDGNFVEQLEFEYTEQKDRTVAISVGIKHTLKLIK